MSRVCEVTGKKVMYGNNVSHAHNKTRRRFDINLQKKTFWVETLNKKVTLKVSAKGLKIIDKKGIDSVIKDLMAEGKKLFKPLEKIEYCLNKFLNNVLKNGFVKETC